MLVLVIGLDCKFWLDTDSPELRFDRLANGSNLVERLGELITLGTCSVGSATMGDELILSSGASMEVLVPTVSLH